MWKNYCGKIIVYNWYKFVICNWTIACTMSWNSFLG